MSQKFGQCLFSGELVRRSAEGICTAPPNLRRLHFSTATFVLFYFSQANLNISRQTAHHVPCKKDLQTSSPFEARFPFTPQRVRPLPPPLSAEFGLDAGSWTSHPVRRGPARSARRWSHWSRLLLRSIRPQWGADSSRGCSHFNGNRVFI